MVGGGVYGEGGVADALCFWDAVCITMGIFTCVARSAVSVWAHGPHKRQQQLHHDRKPQIIEK